MKFIKPLAAALMLLFASLANAQGEVETQDECAPLYAGQHTLVGTVCIKVNVDDVDLHYLLIDDWVLTEAHAWIGDNLNNMPQTSSGNPKVGLFPHAVSGLAGVADYSFKVPISELSVTADTFCSAEILVAAHAVVKRTGAPVDGDDEGSDEGDDKSSKSSKSGKDDQSSKSSKSGNDGQSSKSSKSGKDSQSVKSGKDSSKAAKTKTGSSKGKGFSRYEAKFDKSGKDGSSSKSSKSGKGDAGKSDKSGKDGGSSKSNKSNKSSKSGSSGDGSGGTQTESAWAGTISLSGGSWATYFSFTNECDTDPTDPDPVDPNAWLPVVQPGCANVFATGPGAVTFSSLGLTLPGSAGTVVSLPAIGLSATYDLSDGNIVYGSVSVTTAPGFTILNISSVGDWRISSSNVHNGTLEGFSILPSTYQSRVLKAVPSLGYGHALVPPVPGAPLVIHAVACEAGVTPTN